MTVKLERARTHYSLMRRLLGHSIGGDVESRVYLGSLTYGVRELSVALEATKFPMSLERERTAGSIAHYGLLKTILWFLKTLPP